MQRFDAVIVTGSPTILSKLAPRLPESYLGKLSQLRSMGAVVMTIALKQPLTGGIYWINMLKSEFPFLSLVEHTNFIPATYYGGDHLIYCGDYLEPSMNIFSLVKKRCWSASNQHYVKLTQPFRMTGYAIVGYTVSHMPSQL